MKKITIPGFSAEASLGAASICRTQASKEGSLSTVTVRAAISTGGGGSGGGGFQCFPDDPNCVDCSDDIDNVVCAECNTGSDIPCCADPGSCVVVNQRPTVDCTDSLMNRACRECNPNGYVTCCWDPRGCNIIPSRTQPPTCFRVGGRMICNLSGNLWQTGSSVGYRRGAS